MLMNRGRFGSSRFRGHERDEEQCLVILNPESGCGCCRIAASGSSVKGKAGERQSATRNITV